MTVQARQRLEIIATVMMILASGALAWRALWPADPRNVSPTARVGYQIGDTVPSIDGVDFAQAPAMLILFLRSTCKYCTESMPFYRQLTSSRRTVGVVAVGTESEQVLGDYLAANQVTVDTVRSVEGGIWKVTGTPTVLLVGRDRKVLGVWVGRLDETRQPAVLAAIR